MNDQMWLNNPAITDSLLWSIWETLLMVGLSGLATVVLGVPLGMAVVATRKDGIAPNALVNRLLGFIVNLGRSIPFIILLIVLFPLTLIIMGTNLGWQGMVFPLTVAAVPFFARLVESNMVAVDPSKIEGLEMMGATGWSILWMQVREALPSIIQSITVLLITLVGYSAMGGAVGGGGLGGLAYNYGYNRYMIDVLVITIVVIVVIVQMIQMVGDMLSRYVDHR
ncbi:D-methionine transport system permease protein [Arcanobacterium wilhelmae]|uniref:D-methionine transport system permease protein n=1 Tax=Arcanobacterium wilhelmae TaxID=1803177 RepID=A0ABT9NAF7_9ACTO|nr:methionine ABC transporter permease [Arcanobacterium wilhelmae]MDP9800689.1 D-methionine transport system permease protein [Arcanobacterium wilhelmae]WFN90088.1 ABC transporter permease [Arcanobacterium wilhelmae]